MRGSARRRFLKMLGAAAATVPLAPHAEAKKRLSAKLDRWMREQGDPGAALDTQAQWRAAKQGKHFARSAG